ncbi:hypothetical protein ACP70R_047297 [Stipagrostis hirtigluma subsp. patula]
MATRWSLHDAPPPSPPLAGASAPAPLVHPASSGCRHPPPPPGALAGASSSSAAALAGVSSSSAAALAGATSSSLGALLGSTSSAAAATIPAPGSSISAAVELLPTRLQEGGLPSLGKRKSREGDVSSVAKRKAPGVKRKKRPPTNAQLANRNSPSISVVVRSPIAPAVVRSPGIRILLSAAAARSPDETSHQEPVNTSHGLPCRKKKRKLKSDIWEDFEPIYDDQDFLVEAKCSHCYTVFNATRGYGTSGCRRHLENCDGKNRIDQMLTQLNPDSLSNDESLKDWKLKEKVARQELDWGQHQRSQRLRKISELDRYLEEETMPVDVELDILQHWKMHSTRLPILSCMARDLLAVPASSVASESAFSTGERVISDYRSRK